MQVMFYPWTRIAKEIFLQIVPKMESKKSSSSPVLLLEVSS